jgi:hypothetical protein
MENYRAQRRLIAAGFILAPFVLVAHVIFTSNCAAQSHLQLHERFTLGMKFADIKPILAKGGISEIKVQAQGMKANLPGQFKPFTLTAIPNDPMFTGTITLLIERPFADSFVIELGFKDGTLLRKEWGYLPG